jgi:small subunit ribosomal protein S4e
MNLGKKGATTGLKRKPAPRSWPIHRKEKTWVVRPSSGPHCLENCLPLTIVLRDILGVAQTKKEAKTAISQGKVYVDGKIRRKDNFPVGLMDVISIPDVDGYFRVLPSRKGLILHPITKEEASFKLCRIENKTSAKNGNVQLNFHDGSSMMIKVADPKRPQDNYKTLDTLTTSLPQREILESLKMKEKDLVIITGGKNIGKFGKIVEIERAEGKKNRNALVTIEDEKGKRYQTTLNLVFAIGETQSLISLPEATLDV